MLRRFVKFVLILLIATVCYGHLWGADFENDALDEAEAEKDMMAYVQSTFPHRFGNNLHTVDYVQYELSNHHTGDSEPELNSLEVTDRQNNVVTIKEEFEGNILFYKIDLAAIPCWSIGAMMKMAENIGLSFFLREKWKAE